jgi:dihydrofolate reductase
MRPVNLIAAVGSRGQIGLKGELPWSSSADLAWFKRTTMGGVVIVGYRTYKTMPKLPGRVLVKF